jgi:hypothetical protein
MHSRVAAARRRPALSATGRCYSPRMTHTGLAVIAVTGVSAFGIRFAAQHGHASQGHELAAELMGWFTELTGGYQVVSADLHGRNPRGQLNRRPPLSTKEG